MSSGGVESGLAWISTGRADTDRPPGRLMLEAKCCRTARHARVRWDGEIASLEGLGRAAWFKDSEGNIICIDQEIPAG
jgi:hypothetical protein